MPESERILSTTRLVLEPLLPAHARELYARLEDERLYRFHAGRPVDVEELEQRFERYTARTSPDGLQTWLNYAVRRTEGPYVGWVQATIEGSKATIGYDIFADFWRQGYGAEACGALIGSLRHDHGVTLVAAVVDTENAASIGLLEALGFVLVWTGPSEDMPGRTDHSYELQAPKPPGAASAL